LQENRLITPDRSLGYSKLYLDFLADLPSARSFYGTTDASNLLASLDRQAIDRPALVRILKRQNEAWGAGRATQDAIDRLRDPAAVCVFAGQQAGLFGGPLMTLVKALGAVKRAEQYGQQFGRPVVPVFWIAADDHDFDEINHTWLLNRESEPVRVSYDAPPAVAHSVGRIGLDQREALQAARELFKSTLGETEYTPALSELIDRCYTPNDTVVSAFGKLVTALTADTGLVLFDPSDPQVKKLALPLLEQMIERQADMRNALALANAGLTAAGYHLQVEKNPNATHLFIDREGRTPIHYDGTRFVAGETTFDKAALLGALHEHPEQFSPDVFTRPILQSYLFPVYAQLGGPAEIAYFAQMSGLHQLFGQATPLRLARPTVTLVEKRFEKLLDEYGVRFEAFTGDIEQIVNRVLARSFPADLEQQYGAVRADVASRFEAFTKASLQFDPSMQEFAKQTAGKIDFSLKSFEEKLFSSHKKKQKETRERIYRMARTLYPNQGLQERTLNIANFIARYGFGIVSYLANSMEADQTAHQLISMTEYTN
jgi:bacillithiol synthase